MTHHSQQSPLPQTCIRSYFEHSLSGLPNRQF